MKLNIIFFILFIQITFVYSDDNTSLFKDVNEIKLQSNIPMNWKLKKEVIVIDDIITKFNTIYKTEVENIVNQIFTVSGQTVQINYCLFTNKSLAEICLLKMNSLSGNIIIQKNNIIIETISKTNFLNQKVLKLFGFIDNFIVQQSQIPKDWELWRIIIVQSTEKTLFEEKFGIKVEYIYNQIFNVDNKFIRLNYIATMKKNEGIKLYNNLKKNFSMNEFLKVENTIIEIISEDKSLKNVAVSIYH